MEVDDISSYHDVVTAQKASLQKGINYGVGKNYSQSRPAFLVTLKISGDFRRKVGPRCARTPLKFELVLGSTRYYVFPPRTFL
jgi:hypothetical protein